MALLELLARATPAGVVATDLIGFVDPSLFDRRQRLLAGLIGFAAGVRAGIANGRLNEPIDVWNHVQFSARDRWREINTEAGKVRALLPPFTFTDQEAAIGDVPSVGQHTDQVLAEIGLPADQDRGDAGRRVRYDRVRSRPSTAWCPEQRWFEDFRLGERFLAS